MAEIKIKIRNKEVVLADHSTALDLAKTLNENGPDQALALMRNGELFDLSSELVDGEIVELVNFAHPKGKEIFWHTSAHILAQAVLRLWPDAKPTIGPPIEAGFYYDFANLHISEEDFGKIEQEVQKIIDENFVTKREEFTNKKSAIARFQNNPYKVELINSFEEGVLSGYSQGEFFDLCRGPHLPNLGKVRAFKVLKTSGAYWRADATREMLTRIYAISFPDRKMLREYLHVLEEAQKRDHKVLGPKLDLFSLSELAPGMPFIHPMGMRVWHALLDYWHLCHREAGYLEIKTPLMVSQDLWVQSGHWANYRHNMYTSAIDERSFAIKPMNCPGCMLFYLTQTHSYRQLPLKIAEIGHVHRHEASGALSGLMRVRSFHQDDAHIFLESEQIEEEILKILELVDKIYSTFGLNYHLELSTRPKEGTIGSDEQWDHATASLRRALERSGKEFRINEGDGAFYGPKIDLHIRDALQRTWQCGTIQLDMALPERFHLEYVNNLGERVQPIMIHRALFGSIERFFGILIEHFAGRFPLWLSPRQVRFIPVADRHLPLAQQLCKKFEEAGFWADVDATHESVSKKIRLAQMEQVNYMITIGDQEVESRKLSLRTRENQRSENHEVDPLIEKLLEEKRTRSLTSVF